MEANTPSYDFASIHFTGSRSIGAVFFYASCCMDLILIGFGGNDSIRSRVISGFVAGGEEVGDRARKF